MPLTSDYAIRQYTPVFLQQLPEGKSFDNRVATVDFKSVKTIVLMFNKTLHRFDKLSFVDAEGTSLGSSTMKSPIYCACETLQKFELLQYLLAGVFTGDLDFLAHFLGQQGASSTWLCMFCLAMQKDLGETFRLEGKAPPFPKRHGEHSLQKCFEIYKRDYLSLDAKERTPEKKKQVTQELSFSITGDALANIPLDVITKATMHVILGFTKKIVEWMLALHSKLEALEEEDTKGHTTPQFRQSVVEARDNAVRYCEFYEEI